MVLRDLWEDSSLRNDERSAFQYVAESQDKLEETAKIAAHVSAAIYKSYFNVKPQHRQFKPNDEVLVFLPNGTCKQLVT